MSVIEGAVQHESDSFDATRFDPSPRKLVGLALLIGVVLEIGLRGGLANAVVVVALALIVAVLCTDGRLHRAEARSAAIVALLPTVFLAVRASPWLAWSNLSAVAVLLTAAVLHGRHGSIFDATPRRLLRRGVAGLEWGMASLRIVKAIAPRVSPDGKDGILRVGRALLVAVPVLTLLVGLLASADAVFASLLTPDVDAVPFLGHVLLTLLFAPVVVVLVGSASAPQVDRRGDGMFGVIEVVTMLGLVGVVLALFVASQLVALTDAGDRLIESAGLTPAEYARSGFFQLCWAAGLLLAFLAIVRALASPATLRHRAVVGLGTVVPTLALGLVVVSLRRMALYDDAFGLTMLRLWVVGAAVWMGMVLIMTAVRNLGIGAGREWVVSGAGLAGLLLILVANVVNPEAFVVRHNIERARDGAELDISYLAGLSDDVVPEVADAAAVHSARGEVLRYALRCDDEVSGAAALNLATYRANQQRGDLCGR